MANKDLDYYLSLPYTINIKPITDESGSYFSASVVELDGCRGHGKSPAEAYEMLREVMKEYIEVKLEFGDYIPEPNTDEDYSGKFVLRVPKSLHRMLSEKAAAESVSLNQYCLYQLSEIPFNEKEVFRVEYNNILVLNHTNFFDGLLMGDKWLLQTVYDLATKMIDKGGKMVITRKFTNEVKPEIRAVYDTIEGLNEFVMRVKEYKLA